MNTKYPSVRATAARRWLLSLLVLPGAGRGRLLRAAFISALALNLGANLAGPVWADQRLAIDNYQSQASPQNTGANSQSTYSNPAVQKALDQLNLPLPATGPGRSTLLSPDSTGQFQVNSYTTAQQSRPAVALDSDGDFVVVWQSVGSGGGDNSAYSIQAQRYNSAGIAQGLQFQVNNYTPNNQNSPSIAMDSDGDFVVAWVSFGSSGSDNGSYSIQARRYNSAGTAQGSQFQVNSYTTDQQREAAVAIDSDGDFVVIWNSFGDDSDTGSYSIQGQRYNSLGTAQGGQFRVNSYTTSNQRYPAVAMDSGGNFAVVWNSLQTNGSDSDNYSIQGQRYNAAGGVLGSEFQVNSYTTGPQTRPAVALDSDGDFVAVWQSQGSSGSDSDYWSVQGRRFNSAGTAQGSDFQVNSYTTYGQFAPAVAMDGNGDFAVVWEGQSGNDSPSLGIQGRSFTKSGLPLWGEFQINSYTTNHQACPAVALDSSGDFVAAWCSDGSPGNDNSQSSIQAGRFDLGQMDHQVNSYTTGDQRRPAVALDSNGNFVVVWESNGSGGSDTHLKSIQGQRYNSNGLPLGSQFQVNTFSPGQQGYPAVGMDSDGDFVVVWDSSISDNGDNNFYSIQGQRYNSAGTAQGSQFLVNSISTGAQYNAAVALDGDGDFVVVWQGISTTDSNSWAIVGRRFNSAGTAQGSDFPVNSYTTGHQRYPAVAIDSDGDFVVVWQSEGSSTGSPVDSSGLSVQGQRFNSAGTAQGSQFQVNSYTTGDQGRPTVSLDSGGNFVVAWEGGGIQGQRYNSAGTAQGSQFQVNSYTTGSARYPSVALDNNGDFVVVWQGSGSGGDTSGNSVQGRRYNSAGTAQGSQFQANSYITNSQQNPAVALDSDGDFVVVWESQSLNNPPFDTPLENFREQPVPLAPENDGNFAIAAARFTALGGPQPTALTLHSASLYAAHPAFLAPFAMFLTMLTACLSAVYLRLRRPRPGRVS